MALAVAAGSGGGCARTQQSSADADKQASAQAAGDEVVVSELDRHVWQLAEVARRLPGRSADESRALTADALDQLRQVLIDLMPIGSNGAFLQRMAIMENTAQRLRASGGDASSDAGLEPAMASAVRAAHDAMEEVARIRFRDNADVASALESAGRRVEELNRVRAAMHRFVAAQALRDMTRAAEHMARTLKPPATMPSPG